VRVDRIRRERAKAATARSISPALPTLQPVSGRPVESRDVGDKGRIRLWRRLTVSLGILPHLDLAGRLMAFGLKVLFSITAPLLVVTPSIAADLTYKEYAKESDIWKRGFVFSIAQYMSAMPQPDEEAQYPVRNALEGCLASSTDAVLVRHVEGYVARNRVKPNEPMVRIVMRTLFDLCRSEIEKTKSPRAAPRPATK